MNGTKFRTFYNLNLNTVTIIIVLTLFPVLCSGSLHKTHYIAINQLYVDVTSMSVQPGDTILLQAGKRKSLKILNVKGDSLNYVVIRNDGGDVIVENDDFHYGFSLSHCSYFRLTGNYKNETGYGIKILQTGNGASGLSFDNLTTNYEADHIEIAHTGFAGIFAFSQPTCDLSANRENFVQRNTIIHDNYIHDTYGEGMYIGSSFYNGFSLTCDGQTIIANPHEIHGLKVYNNILKNNGYDGLQICCASEDAEVYNNLIYNYGTKKEPVQQSGIQIGSGTKLRCYNNLILNGSGIGIMMLGFADSYIYNNVIVNSGKDFFSSDPTVRIYGIFIDDRCTLPNTSFYILNNTIIKPKSDGIRFFSTISSKNLIANNLIIQPGSIYIYEPQHYKYIYPKSGTDLIMQSNFFTNQFNGETDIDSINILKSVNNLNDYISDYQLQGRGIDVSNYGVNTDFFNHPRLSLPSIGAFEYTGKVINSMKINQNVNLIYNNESRDFIIENKSDENIKSIRIYNSSGSEVFYKNFDVSDLIMFKLNRVLPKGIYLLKIENMDTNFSRKIYIK